jgi:hypothetical protein
MADKPVVADSRWATDETNNTAPSSGQRDTGWTAGQIAVSDYFNVLALEAYKWFLYLSDGALTGNHTIDGTFGVTGNVDFDADLNVDGSVVIDGNVTLGGQFVGTLESDDLLINDDAVITDDASVGGDLTVTGNIYHGEITRLVTIPFLEPGLGYTGSINKMVGTVGNVGTGDRYYAFNHDSPLAIDLPVEIGERIKSVKAKVRCNDSGGTQQIHLAVHSQLMTDAVAPPGTVAQLGSTQTITDGTGNFQSLTVSSLTTVVAADTAYSAFFQINDTGSPPGDVRLYALWVTVDRVP